MSRTGSMQASRDGHAGRHQPADIYTGRISLGADLERHVHADGHAPAARAAPSATRVGRHSRSTRARRSSITAPVAGKSYKRLLTIEVIATDGIGLAMDANGVDSADRDRGHIAVPLAPIGVPTPTAARSTSTTHDPPPGRPAAADGRGDERQRQADRGAADLHHRQRGPDDHGDHARPRARSSAASCAISATVTDPAGVLDSSVIAVIGDDTGTPLFELQLKPDGGGVYSILFDTRKLTRVPGSAQRHDLCIVFPTISFRASDELGNETRRRLRLRARQHRAGRRPRSAQPARRSSKDGSAARASSIRCRVNTLRRATCPTTATVVPQVFDLRARIEDDGNHAATGLKVVADLAARSRTRPPSTSSTTTNQPLIVDTDGDGWLRRDQPAADARPPSRRRRTTRC